MLVTSSRRKLPQDRGGSRIWEPRASLSPPRPRLPVSGLACLASLLAYFASEWGMDGPYTETGEGSPVNMIETETIETTRPVTFSAKAFAAQNSTSRLTPHSIQRRTTGPQDVQIEILYCGVCHSDLHQVRDEWKSVMP